MVPLFRGVPLVLCWYSVGILERSAGVSGNIQLFRHFSGCFAVPLVFRVPFFRDPAILVLQYAMFMLYMKNILKTVDVNLCKLDKVPGK